MPVSANKPVATANWTASPTQTATDARSNRSKTKKPVTNAGAQASPKPSMFRIELTDAAPTFGRPPDEIARTGNSRNARLATTTTVSVNAGRITAPNASHNHDRPDTAIVMLSMHLGSDFMIRALEAGALGYVLKESASEEIIDAVLAASEGRRHLSPKVAAIVAEGLAARQGAPTPRDLSRREREILRLVADGHTSIVIGEKLNLSQKMVDTYRSRLMHKLTINSVAGLTKVALQHGLTTLQ